MFIALNLTLSEFQGLSTERTLFTDSYWAFYSFLHERSFSIRCPTTGHQTFLQYEFVYRTVEHFELPKLITCLTPHPRLIYCVSGQQTSRTMWFIIRSFQLDRLRCRLICMGASRQFCDLWTLPFNRIALIISASCRFLCPYTPVHSKMSTETFPGLGIYESQFKPAATLHNNYRQLRDAKMGRNRAPQERI